LYIIFISLETYESASEAEKEIVATSESECESRKGERKIKNNKYQDYVSYPGPPRLTLSREESSNIAG
jgi:hypothetical protein